MAVVTEEESIKIETEVEGEDENVEVGVEVEVVAEDGRGHPRAGADTQSVVGM